MPLHVDHPKVAALSMLKNSIIHKMLTSRRVLEREKTDKRRQTRPDPP